MSKSRFSVWLAMAGAAMLWGCRDRPDNHKRIEEPFGFAEIRELAHPIGSVPPATLRGDMPLVARLYLEALARFDGIYGDGVGPAKRTPDYLACKSAFQMVAKRIAVLPIADAGLVALWDSLRSCRARARMWSGPAEMATFGNDLKGMAEGAMLVLAYATTASGSRVGPRFYRELREDDRK